MRGRLSMLFLVGANLTTAAEPLPGQSILSQEFWDLKSGYSQTDNIQYHCFLGSLNDDVQIKDIEWSTRYLGGPNNPFINLINDANLTALPIGSQNNPVLLDYNSEELTEWQRLLFPGSPVYMLNILRDKRRAQRDPNDFDATPLADEYVPTENPLSWAEAKCGSYLVGAGTIAKPLSILFRAQNPSQVAKINALLMSGSMEGPREIQFFDSPITKTFWSSLLEYGPLDVVLLNSLNYKTARLVTYSDPDQLLSSILWQLDVTPPMLIDVELQPTKDYFPAYLRSGNSKGEALWSIEYDLNEGISAANHLYAEQKMLKVDREYVSQLDNNIKIKGDEGRSVSVDLENSIDSIISTIDNNIRLYSNRIDILNKMAIQSGDASLNTDINLKDGLSEWLYVLKNVDFSLREGNNNYHYIRRLPKGTRSSGQTLDGDYVEISTDNYYEFRSSLMVSILMDRLEIAWLGNCRSKSPDYSSVESLLSDLFSGYGEKYVGFMLPETAKKDSLLSRLIYRYSRWLPNDSKAELQAATGGVVMESPIDGEPDPRKSDVLILFRDRLLDEPYENMSINVDRSNDKIVDGQDNKGVNIYTGKSKDYVSAVIPVGYLYWLGEQFDTSYTYIAYAPCISLDDLASNNVYIEKEGVRVPIEARFINLNIDERSHWPDEYLFSALSNWFDYPPLKFSMVVKRWLNGHSIADVTSYGVFGKCMGTRLCDTKN